MKFTNLNKYIQPLVFNSTHALLISIVYSILLVRACMNRPNNKLGKGSENFR